MFSTIAVDNDGTELAYIDSGAPSSGGEYTTIFAVHGLAFSSPIFQKVSAISRNKGLRFVSINRRGYKGSTPFSDADAAILSKGTDAEKSEWIKQRGIEIANFVDAFVQRENLPKITPDGRRGGVALLGWSLGAAFTTSAVAHIGSLPLSVQARLASYLRAHLLQDVPSISFGLPLPPGTWSPQLDTTIPENKRIPATVIFLTSYFQHGDLSTRDTTVLEYVLPTTFRKPSIYNMSATEIADIIDVGPMGVDDPFMFYCMPQNHEVYMAGSFDKAVKARLPHMKIWVFVGESTLSFPFAALWSMQDDDKAHGEGNFHYYKTLPKANHFMHWDEPGQTVEAYLEMLSEPYE